MRVTIMPTRPPSAAARGRARRAQQDATARAVLQFFGEALVLLAFFAVVWLLLAVGAPQQEEMYRQITTQEAGNGY